MKPALASFCLIASAVASIAGAQKTPDIRLDTDPAQAGSSYEQKMAVTGSSVYVAWRDGRHHTSAPFLFDAYFNRSHDGGATWLPSDVRVNTNASGSVVSLSGVAAEGHTVYVLYGDDRTGQSGLYLNRSLDGGVTWLASDLRMSSRTGAGLVAASGSSVHVVWSEDRNGQGAIYFDRSLDRGATWLPAPVRIDTATAGTIVKIATGLVVDGTDVFVTWDDLWGGVYFDRSSDRGATWLPTDVRVSSGSASTARGSQLAVSGAGIFVVWMDSRNGQPDIYFNRSLDRGASWLGADLRLDTDLAGVGGSSRPRIAAAGSRVYTVWEDHRSGRDVYFNRSLDGGSSWLSSDLRLDSGSYRSESPEIAASATGVFVAWKERRGTLTSSGYRKPHAYFDRSLDGGTTWLANDVRLNRSTAINLSVDYPQIAATGSSVHVTWSEWRRFGNNASSIFYNIPFGAQPYGAPTAGTNGVPPRLSARGFPVIGQVPTLQVADGLGAAPGALLMGIGPASKITQPFLGGTLLVAPLLGAPITLDAAGAASFALPVPDDPALVGLNLNFQAGLVDAGAPMGVSLTNGLEIWIG